MRIISASIVKVRIVMWGLAHLAFGLAFWKLGKLEKVISAIFIANTIKVAAGIIGRTVGPAFLASGGGLVFVIFTLPLFLLIGYWLWQKANIYELEKA